MKSKFLLFLTLILMIILNACSPFVITSSSGTPPTPEVGSVPATGYQPVDVDQVEVEVGVGSPVPVQVAVSGNLPDSCAQIELVQQKQAGSNFQITISTLPSNAESCVQDALPFRISIPLNITNLPAGSYTVEVNSSSTDFDVNTANTTSSLPAANYPITKNDIQVNSLNVEVGVGSPIPVHAIVGLSLRNTCAQLGEVRLHREGKIFYVRLIGDIAERADCKEDLPMGPLPFRLEIPLNVVNLPEGPYEVNVNGVTASFDPRPKPASNTDFEASTPPTGQTCTDPAQVPVENGKVSYNGISFNIDPSLNYGLAARSCSATENQEQQMDNEAHPPYTEFYFPTYSRRNVDSQPQIRVYEVKGNMQNYLFPINSLGDLQTTVEQRPEPVTWFQHSPLHARQAYVDFANGAGVRGLIQYMQDVFFYTNNGLIYEFQGLTQDGRYFVSVRYPVSVPFLMELDGLTLPPTNVNPRAIEISEWPNNYEQQRQVIEAYNSEALQRFEQMSDTEALPNIDLLDALVQSIEVSQP